MAYKIHAGFGSELKSYVRILEGRAINRLGNEQIPVTEPIFNSDSRIPISNIKSKVWSIYHTISKKEEKTGRDDNQASSSTNRVKFFKSKQKEKYSIPI